MTNQEQDGQNRKRDWFTHTHYSLVQHMHYQLKVVAIPRLCPSPRQDSVQRMRLLGGKGTPAPKCYDCPNFEKVRAKRVNFASQFSWLRPFKPVHESISLFRKLPGAGGYDFRAPVSRARAAALSAMACRSPAPLGCSIRQSAEHNRPAWHQFPVGPKPWTLARPLSRTNSHYCRSDRLCFFGRCSGAVQTRFKSRGNLPVMPFEQPPHTDRNRIG